MEQARTGQQGGKKWKMQPTQSRSPGKYLDRRVIPSGGSDRLETGEEGECGE